MAEKTGRNRAETGTGSPGGRAFAIMTICTLVVLVGAAAAYLIREGYGANAQSLVPHGPTGAQQDFAIGPMVEIEPFVVNILDQGSARYLKASLTMEFASEKVAEEALARMPQIRDTVILHAGSKTFSELRDLQGKLQLRAELVSRLNDLMETGEIKRIYFTDFVVQ